MSTQKITVVVPVKDDERVFNLLEDFIGLKNVHGVNFIVVCNGSTEYFEKSIRKFVNSFANLRVLSLKQPNIASAINLGIKKSKSEKILIIDSDCRVSGKFYKTISDSLDTCLAVRGGVNFKGTNIISRLSAKLRSHVYEKEKDLFFMPNLGFRKEIFKVVGKFKKFKNNGGHTIDSEFGYRASKQGLDLCKNPNSKVTHYCHTNLLNEIRVSFYYGQGRAYCYRTGLLGEKNLPNFLRSLAIPCVFDKRENLLYNLYVFAYIIVWDFGFLSEMVLRKLP